jgi:hypothetical protein
MEFQYPGVVSAAGAMIRMRQKHGPDGAFQKVEMHGTLGPSGRNFGVFRFLSILRYSIGIVFRKDYAV